VDPAVGGRPRTTDPGAWQEAYQRYARLDRAELGPEDLDALADAAWWTCRVDEAIAARQRAHAGWLRAGDARRAGRAGRLLYYDYLYRGEETVAGGWLRRARRHLAAEDQGQVPATYRHNYRRLVEVKRRHDPGNLFRLNQNVHPASLPAAAPTR